MEPPRLVIIDNRTCTLVLGSQKPQSMYTLCSCNCKKSFATQAKNSSYDTQHISIAKEVGNTRDMVVPALSRGNGSTEKVQTYLVPGTLSQLTLELSNCTAQQEST